MKNQKRDITEKSTKIKIHREITKELGMGANDLKIFAISNSVLKPDFYSTSFLVTGYPNQLTEISPESIQFGESENEFLWIVLPIIGVIIAIVIYLKKLKQSK